VKAKAPEQRVTVVVRPERPADHAAIAEVVEAAFGQPNEVKLVELVRESDGYVPELALVAEQDGAIVGHTMFTYVTLRGEEDREVLLLAPVAVAPQRQSLGIGSALVRAGLERADARHEPLVVVQGHPTYYPRFGFESARSHGIKPPSPDIPDAAFMVLRLAAYDARHRGQIVYPPAFDGI
jgi:putative acetyltransferase